MLRLATEFIILASALALVYITMLFSCAAIDRCFV